MRASRSRFVLAMGAAVALVLGLGDGGLAAATPIPRLTHNGRWLADPQGRVVMIHGGNVVALFGDANLNGEGARDVRWSAELPKAVADAGFNGVRLIVFMDRIVPQPGRVDQAYLDAVAKTVRAYAANGVYVLIDIHQDEYGPSVGVRGMPAWMTLTDGLQRVPGLRFPNGYFRDPAVQRAFDNFWANKAAAGGLGVQDAYVKAAAVVAAEFASESAVFGLDLMNEPATGSVCSQPDPRSANCPELERDRLGPFYAKAGVAIGSAAPNTLLFVEPFMLQGALGVPIDTPLPGLRQQGLSFHNYGPFRPTRENVSESALADAVRRDGAILNTEWGNTNDAAEIAAQAQDFDGRMIPWLAWTRGPFEALLVTARKNPAGAEGHELRAYARPYPTATAGTPQALTFDADKGVLDYSWSTKGPDRQDRSGLLTEIRMPAPSFPAGYVAEAHGGRIVSQPDAPVLRIRALSGAQFVEVHASARGALPPLAVPRKKAGTGARLSLDSLLADLLRDPRAKAIVEGHLPSLKSADVVALAPQASLRSLQPYLPDMTPEVARQIEEELSALPPS